MILLRENLGPATMIHNPLVEGSNPSGGTYNAGESGLPQSSLLLRPNLRFTDPLSDVKVPLASKTALANDQENRTRSALRRVFV